MALSSNERGEAYSVTGALWHMYVSMYLCMYVNVCVTSNERGEAYWSQVPFGICMYVYTYVCVSFHDRILPQVLFSICMYVCIIRIFVYVFICLYACAYT